MHFRGLGVFDHPQTLRVNFKIFGFVFLGVGKLLLEPLPASDGELGEEAVGNVLGDLLGRARVDDDGVWMHRLSPFVRDSISS